MAGDTLSGQRLRHFAVICTGDWFPCSGIGMTSLTDIGGENMIWAFTSGQVTIVATSAACENAFMSKARR